MSEFIIRVLKWLAALVTAYFLLFLLFFLLLLGIGIALQPAPERIEPGAILVLDLGFNLMDSPGEEDASVLIRDALAGKILPTATLRKVLEALRSARGDADVHGLLLTGSLLPDGTGANFAALRELRRAVREFGEEKPVWAYLESDSLRDYYLKSAATEILANPQAMVDFRGLRAERLYLGEALGKVGIDLQVIALEEYKTAWESFERGEMSDQEKEQLAALIGEMWTAIVSDIAESRNLDVDALNEIAASELVVHAAEVIDSGFADLELNHSGMIEKLAGEVGYDVEGESFKQYGFLDYAKDAGSPALSLALGGSGNQVAILYIEGILVDGESEDGVIGSHTLIRHLRELRREDTVKAVVLRINSPGGSATASSKVLREIERTREEKPVVVSMGGIATSAGYMLSAAGDRIFAEPTTITGSIGVVMMLPNVAELADKLSIQFDGVETHPFAGTFSIGRAKTPEEMRQLRSLATDFYNEFVASVAENRGLGMEETRSLAKGRVWSGTSAIELGLADETGGLMAAVQRAADLAGIGDAFEITERPRPMSLEERISEFLINAGIVRPDLRHRGVNGLLRDFEREAKRLSLLQDPHGQYAILPYTLRIH